MLEDDDLDAAVAQGIVNAAQAASLRDLARQRERERAIALGHEERFRFMRGFNDVFFAIGVVLFVGGLLYFTPRAASGAVIAAAVVWGLAELLVGRLRLVLPGILLASAFVGLVFLAATQLPVEAMLAFGAQPRPMLPPTDLLDALHFYPGGPLAFAARALIAAAAAAAFYWRFKLPFTLLPLAASLCIAAVGVASFVVPQSVTISDSIVLLVCGLGVFAAAMSFDASDRERLTRRADCAFWLHLLAAPLIVHSVISLASSPLAGTLARYEEPFGPDSIVGAPMNASLAMAIVLIVVALAIVAILIDRRALLVAGLAYLGGAIGYALTGAGSGLPDDGIAAFAATLVILGAFVLTLGAGWVPLRRRLLALLSPAISNRLPPVPVRL